MEKDKKKEKKKRNLNTVEHSIKRSKKKRTFLGKIDSAYIVKGNFVFWFGAQI